MLKKFSLFWAACWTALSAVPIQEQSLNNSTLPINSTVPEPSYDQKELSKLCGDLNQRSPLLQICKWVALGLAHSNCPEKQTYDESCFKPVLSACPVAAHVEGAIECLTDVFLKAVTNQDIQGRKKCLSVAPNDECAHLIAFSTIQSKVPLDDCYDPKHCATGALKKSPAMPEQYCSVTESVRIEPEKGKVYTATVDGKEVKAALPFPQCRCDPEQMTVNRSNKCQPKTIVPPNGSPEAEALAEFERQSKIAADAVANQKNVTEAFAESAENASAESTPAEASSQAEALPAEPAPVAASAGIPVLTADGTFVTGTAAGIASAGVVPGGAEGAQAVTAPGTSVAGVTDTTSGAAAGVSEAPVATASSG